MNIWTDRQKPVNDILNRRNERNGRKIKAADENEADKNTVEDVVD
jgi:hypothetical protein